MLFLSLAAAGVLTCAPLFWSLPTAFLSGTAAAAGIAIVNSVGNLAGFVSPYMVGYLKDLTQSTQSGMYVLAALLVLGAVAVADAGPDGEPLALYRQGIAVPRLAANLSMMYTEHPFLERFAARAMASGRWSSCFPTSIPPPRSVRGWTRMASCRRCSTRRPATGRPASAASPRCPVGRTSSGAGWTRRWNTPRGWATAACTSWRG